MTMQLPIRYELEGLVFGAQNDDGSLIFNTKPVEGWASSRNVDPRTEAQANRDGLFRGPNYRRGRVIELEGRTESPTRAARTTLAERMASLCADPYAQYLLTRIDPIRTRSLWVELNDKITIVEQPDGISLDYNIQLLATDGRSYGSEQAYDGDVSTPDTGGILWNGTPTAANPSGNGGLEFTLTPIGVTGWQYTAMPGDPALVVAKNFGTLAATIRAVITGPISTPRIQVIGGGGGITWAGIVPAGGELELDTATGKALVGGADRSLQLTEYTPLIVPPGGELVLALAGSDIVVGQTSITVYVADTYS